MNEASFSKRYQIGGMDCAACANKIDTAVRRLPGVSDVNVSATAGTMTIKHLPEAALDTVETTVTRLGYSISANAGANARADPLPAHDHEHPDHDHAHDHHDEAATESSHGHNDDLETGPWWRSSKAKLTLASGAAMVAAYLLGHFFPSIGPYAFVGAMLVGLIPITRRAVMAALAGIPFTIETLMTIAAIGAVLIDAGEEAATVVFLFLVGELLEGIAASRARASIRSLSALVPKTAFRQENGRTQEVPADLLVIGETILVRPGDRIPADGTIIDGESAIDEAPVTGESTPVRKGRDESVFAGTINGEAALRVRVTAAASDNTIARVVKLVEEAQESKSPTERFIDRFSRYYTPGVLATGALIAIVPPLLLGSDWTEWIYKGLAVLLIGCPCALVISTPAAIAASLSTGARRGLLLKGGAVLEGMGHLGIIAFDKTGTLTEGKPVVTDIIGASMPEIDVLRLAAAIETGSSHPLALAILRKATDEAADVPQATGLTVLGGKGVTATVEGEMLFLGSLQAASQRQPLPADLKTRTEALNADGKTVSVLIVGDRVAGAIAMRDQPRADAAAGVSALRRAGLRVLMLTGDNARAAKAIGAMVGIDDIRAELLPEDKLRIIGELKAAGHLVAKVGDGINDAPALAAADIGIAMGGATDVALETADAAILHGRVGDIHEMITLSQRTMGNIKQNITIALGLKAVFLITTIAGITGLWPAILADTGATVLVTINALRLLAPVRSAA